MVINKGSAWRGRHIRVSTYYMEANMIPYTKQAPRMVLSFKKWYGNRETLAKFLSHKAKRAKPMTPKTIRQMMVGLFH